MCQVRLRLVEERDAARAQVAALTETFDGIVAAAADQATDDEHDPEGHTIAYERAQVAALLTVARGRVAEAEAALARYEAGEYGRCEVCGEQIGEARLAARPSARRCVRCAAAR